MRPFQRLTSLLVGCFLATLATAGHAQAPGAAGPRLGLPDFPSGKLSPAQLAPVAEAIHRLEDNPLAQDGQDARRKVLTWLMGSPDVTIDVCSAIMEPLTERQTETSAMLLMQSLFSSAAFVIEHPDQARDAAAVNLGGVEGVLRTYAALTAALGADARLPAVERWRELREQGRLAAHVRELTAQCKPRP